MESIFFILGKVDHFMQNINIFNNKILEGESNWTYFHDWVTIFLTKKR